MVVLIIFPVILHPVINFRMLSVGGQGGKSENPGLITHIPNKPIAE